MWMVLAFVLVAAIPVSLVGVISVLDTRSEAVNQSMDGSTPLGKSTSCSAPSAARPSKYQ